VIVNSKKLQSACWWSITNQRVFFTWKWLLLVLLRTNCLAVVVVEARQQSAVVLPGLKVQGSSGKWNQHSWKWAIYWQFFLCKSSQSLSHVVAANGGKSNTCQYNQKHKNIVEATKKFKALAFLVHHGCHFTYLCLLDF